MVRFEFNPIRYLTILAASLSLVFFLICTLYSDINSSIFELNLYDNLEFYLGISFLNYIFTYICIKNSAKSYFSS